MFLLYRWVDPEFEDEEEMRREVEAGNSSGEEVSVEMEDNGDMVNNVEGKENTNIREEDEKVVVDIEMEELQPLKP